ncbi:MAG: CoA transferase [Crocinitomicaceae bacterium]|nr:CoA transferase [Flavobacteriales bacterium]NQZ37359.1 CoA transferase [Crocinitomicaceae bacterium]
MTLPLEGIRVIDVSTVLAGPSVGTFFAELGADVLKIEHPTHPDVTRSWKLPKEKRDTSVSAYFSSINYLKEYASLNLKDSTDLKTFLNLIVDADILITNFKLGDAEKFGIEDDKLHSVNPRLIIGKINGYGAEDDRVAYDLILQAESGFMSMNGTPESGPVKMPVAMIDVMAAHHLKEGILLALYEREKSGKGKSMSVSLYDAALSSLVNQASNYLMSDHVPQRIGSLHPNIAPYGELFKTADDFTITFAIGSNDHFEKLCCELGADELILDDQFSSNQSRVVNRIALKAKIEPLVAARSSESLLSALQKLNVPVGKIKDLQEVFSSDKAKSLVREEVISGISTKRVTSVVFK